MMQQYHKINAPFKRDDNGKPILDAPSRPEFLDLANYRWDAWEKLDGMNIRIVYSTGRDSLTIFGRTDRAQIPGDLWEHIEKTWFPVMHELAYTLELSEFTLYGEGIGPGIQKGSGYGPTKQFIPFDLETPSAFWSRNDLSARIQSMGVPFACYLGHGTLPDWITRCSAGFARTSAVTTADDGHLSEGYICIPDGEFRNKWGERIITKIKFRDYM